jgi:hypothetical protein
MEMPKPTEEHLRLVSLMAGRWTGVEKMHPSPWDPQGGIAKATVDVRSACDGFCVVTDYEQKRGGKVSFVGHGVMGYDARNRRYLWHWTDTVGGMPPEAKPGMWDGESLTFHSAGFEGRQRYTFRFPQAGVYEFRIDVSPDGNVWGPFIEGRYVRKGKKGAGGKKGKKKKAKKRK